MPFDNHRNLAVSTVATAPSPATSGLTLTLATGEGARMPAVPFNATVWSASTLPTPISAEIVRVTAMSGDQITAMLRAQEQSVARAIVVGDLFAATVTVKALTDVESGANFPLITTPGPITLTAAGAVVKQATDAGTVTLFGGSGAVDLAKGSAINFSGKDSGGAGLGGSIDLYGMSGPTGRINLGPGGPPVKGVMHASGGFSWGSAVDPGTGSIMLGGAAPGAGNIFTILYAGGRMDMGNAGTATASAIVFWNANGPVGFIQTTGAGTAYLTSSDARLKTDRGLLTDPKVLRDTKIHHFTWNSDGISGRGVFAQEAVTVAPFAVSVGTDERDDAGNLKQPWGVDYSRYVPDLIVGWQQHDGQVEALTARIEALETALARRPATDGPSLFAIIVDRLRGWLARLPPLSPVKV